MRRFQHQPTPAGDSLDRNRILPALEAASPDRPDTPPPGRRRPHGRRNAQPGRQGGEGGSRRGKEGYPRREAARYRRRRDCGTGRIAHRTRHAPLASPCHQRIGRDHPYQPGPQQHGKSGESRRRRRHGRLLHPGIRHRRHGARQQAFALRIPHLPDHGRRGGNRGQQQRRGRDDGALRIRPRARGGGLPRRAHRDRRVLPHPRHHGPVRRHHGGSGHHQQDPSA